MILRSACITLLLGTTSAFASAPKVVTDIPPIQSLVAMVMGQIGSPDALVEAGASPHDMALRPSQAQSLSKADLVIWIGPQMSPGFEDQLEVLAPNATQVALIDIEGAHLLPYRENALFEHDHHEDDHEEHDDHDEAHDDHDDHGEEHDEHGDEHDEKDDDGHDDHGHDNAPDGETTVDPHLWLDPENAMVWLPKIAQALASVDQDNSDQYLQNAAEAIDLIKAAQVQAQARLEPAKDVPLAAYHDAFQYYEQAFGLHVIGAISDSDAVQPGPKRIDTLRTAFESDQPVCFLMEPGANERLLTSVNWDPDTAQIARIDPLGGALETGAGLYPALIQDIATRIATCVTHQ
ncbi:zinc ABC transporter substrate-binding protein [Pelagimonas varians]|uniref:High-affinity zinc uptake system protein ZnuA n=1 Tax=Pelagimonas varians TaxID=696760 RepID=A0A238L4X3_9RHOB|nr:zinc ABC transporter substrate-binding protein [Pelagimonas varians]PYG25621.1 zinc transport system substrate-binding protein [Pelagimonas varians]SMX50124.1 High-affinity zinc uptake system protein ZnuA precursor [Pelagimonas varians]